MRRFYGLMTAIVLAIVVTGYAQEKLTLTQAVFVDTGATEFRVSSLYLNRQGSEIRAIFTEVVPGTTDVRDERTCLGVRLQRDHCGLVSACAQ
jgi:hypothetical protein